MADMTITGDAKFGSIVTEMQKVEKASDSMKRKVDNIGGSKAQQGKSGHQRPGMGLLEVSRGVEDFAVAGMRGLLNNIPGIIMSFGGGMGLAAVVSLAAVGITLFGKSLMDLANPNKKTAEDIKALKDQTEKYSASLVKSKDKLDQFKLSQEAAFRGGIADAADKEMIRRLGDPSGSFGAASKKEQERRAARDRMSALEEERDTLMGFPGITPKAPEILDFKDDAESAAKLVEKLKAREEAIKNLQDEVAIAGNANAMATKVRDLEGALAFAEKNMEGFSYQSDKAGKTIKATMPYLSDMVSYLSRLDASDDPLAPLTVEDGAVKRARFMLTNSTQQIKIEKEKIAEIKKQLELIQEQGGNKKDTLDLLEKEQEKNKDSLAAAIEAESAASRTLKTKEQELAVQKEIDMLQYGKSGAKGIPIFGGILDYMASAKNQIDEERLNQRFAAIDTKLSGMGIGGGDMLSSSGRIGGSVAEYNSAIATINYQRETLKVLREIARNSARKQSSTYN